MQSLPASHCDALTFLEEGKTTLSSANEVFIRLLDSSSLQIASSSDPRCIVCNSARIVQLVHRTMCCMEGLIRSHGDAKLSFVCVKTDYK